ncbi:MAG TPA: hypothetical protein PK867_22350 [Pirellulales bacterium]|nr:hypothetical protein [Pirellulales bacterium]
MQESDTYLMILEEGEEKGQAIATREAIVVVAEMRLGPCTETFRADLANVTDLDRLKRMYRRAIEANNWQEILETP